MQIKQLEVNSFRNLDLNFFPTSGFNLILGENGSGKSNFLDAIYFLANGRSHKKYSSDTNINWDDKIGFSTIQAATSINNQENDLIIIFSKNDENIHSVFKVNDLPVSRKSFSNNLLVILFTPDSLNIIAGSPEQRRSVLDQFLQNTNIEYSTILNEYSNILRNRKRILIYLNNRKAKKKELIYWTERLIDLGSQITHLRSKILFDLTPFIKHTSEKLFGLSQSKIDVQYISKLKKLKTQNEIRKNLAAIIKENINKEIFAKSNLYGPHRDDFDILLSGKSVKIYGSRGQQRLMALIIKFSFLAYIEKVLNSKGILLLDDIFSELDSKNQQTLEKVLLDQNTQVFLTSVELERIPEGILKRSEKLILGE